MSYVLSVFAPPADRPLPDDIYEIDALVSRLHKSRQVPDARMIELAQLLARSPGYSGKVDAALIDKENSVEGGAVYNVGIVAAQAHWMVPAIARQACKLDLCVLDGQAAMAFLPNGKVVRAPATQQKAHGEPEAMQARDLAAARLAAGEPYWLHLSCHFTDLSPSHDVKHAFKELERLRAKPAGLADPMFPLLIKRLTRRFPWISACDGLPTIWACDPADGRPNNWICSLAVKAEHIGEVRPVVIELANAFGVNIFDPHAMQIFRSDGDIVWNGHRWSSRKRYLSESLIRNTTIDAMRPLFEAHGFKHVKSADGFVRLFKDGRQEVRFWSNGYAYLSATVLLKLKEKSGIRMVVNPDMHPGRAGEFEFRAPLHRFAMQEDFGGLYMDRTGVVGVYQDAHFAPLIEGLEKIFLEKVFPLLDGIAGLKDMDRLLNGDRTFANPFYSSRIADRLIVAHLAGNAYFNELAAEEERLLHDYSWEREREKEYRRSPDDVAEDREHLARLLALRAESERK